MISMILCEGTTDAILLSYCLEKLYNWKHSKKCPNNYKNIKINTDNQSLNWYCKENNFLAIWGVGGKDNFKNIIHDFILQMIINNPIDSRIQKIAILTDKDDNDMESLEKLQASWFGHKTVIKNQEWVRNIWDDGCGNDIETEILSIIIPNDKQGALETVLLDSISEDNYNKHIVNECERFIKQIRPNASKYISSDRLELKAHLSATFSVISPERVFFPLNELIVKTEWEKSQTIMECFYQLEKI